MKTEHKKYRVRTTLTTIDGTLYENDVVSIQGKEKNGDLRVKDTMGRIWFLNEEMLV
jgi:hypothetical protein|tara:strand:- start:178 stop:348 length:171 start_codon:yes stop_codon:yes gene_type:complete